MRNLILLSLIFLFCIGAAARQSPLKLPAKRVTSPIKIDGLITDEGWKEAPLMTDLVEFRPTPGKKEDPTNKTLAYLLYDDEGIYFGGYCYERTRDSIARELSGRDGFGANDYVGIILDTYYDKLNAFEYFVTPLNEQWDSKMSPPQSQNSDSEDFSWNAVWKSGAVIHEDGWSFEMFIPYSAIRFGKKEVQDWGLNITRRRRKTEQQYTWNPINPNVNGFLTQEGIWSGISDIKPPLRLQFSPYFSTYVNHYPSSSGANEWTSSVNGGMDVKYGINQALTLDMTLIPDFGQVQSDNQVLNLTPFEVKFNENRSFFTEGTELFNKGDFFYSRRVGGRPLHFYDVEGQLGANERIIKNPTETKLINATKISGRLQGGLGIGLFNAITKASYAIIEDDAKNRRRIQTNPLTNYNIIVLNQSLKNNSSITLLNTNVLRDGKDYDANLTSVLFDFNDKKNTWNFGGKVANSRLMSYQTDNKPYSGYNHNLYFGKTSGNFNFRISQDISNDKFYSGDLGYFTFNNFLDHSLWTGYKWLKPTKWYNNLYLNLNAFVTRRLNPSDFRGANFNMNVNGQLKNLWYAGMFTGYEPKGNDFNEPRQPGRVFKGWSSWFIGTFIETNIAKKYSFGTELLMVNRSLFASKRYQVEFNHRFRFNDKFSISHELELGPQTNNVGYADTSGVDIIFGRRDRNEVENIFGIKYNFNAKMGITARVRHYWSKVKYKEYFTLLQNGGLEKNTSYNENNDQNVNFFNVDVVYTWQFAPGSFINVVWKDASFDFKDSVEADYFQNINHVMRSDQNNNLSFKIIYFLDYLSLKKKSKPAAL